MGESKGKRGPQSWRQGGGPAPDRNDPAYKWKKGDDAASGGLRKRLVIVLLLVGLVACAVGIYLVLLVPEPPPKPGLVVVAADPAEDALNLAEPLDLYGYLAAQEFLTKTKTQEGDPQQGIPQPIREKIEALPADPDGLDKWAGDLNLAKYDPLILYAGLHAGTTPGGPVLFAGKGNRVPVKDLITMLEKKVPPKTRKVLILDPGRLTPDPLYGLLADDFAAQLKGLSGAVSACPNLVVMCGASPGERGWESEELGTAGPGQPAGGTTAFAHHVLVGLQGHAAQDRDAITAAQLFEYARRETVNWTTRNRPTPQTPFLLPDGQEGQDRAAGMVITIRPPTVPTPRPTAPAAFVPPDALRAHWTRHDELASQGPPAWAYTPRAWRRYRELLLRYEAGVRAGEPRSQGVLHDALLAQEAKGSRMDAVPVRAEQLDSRANALGLWAGVTGKVRPRDPADPQPALDPANADSRAEYADWALGQLDRARGPDFDAGLRRAADLLAKLPSPGRPTEAHLPVMADHFYQAVLTPKAAAPDGWAKAVAAKRQAERAAVGLPDVGADAGKISSPLSPERVWPVIGPVVLAADRQRRAGEDQLFGTAPADQAAAAKSLEDAAKGYRQAADLAEAVRYALAVRDRVTADLPFLTRWVAATARSPKDAAVTRVLSLWEDAHNLAACLDALAEKPCPKLREDATRVNDAFEAVRGDFKKACAGADQHGLVMQETWWDKQVVLAVPLIDAGLRMRLLTASRVASAGLAEGREQPAASTARLKRELAAEAAARGQLARAALGKKLLDDQHEADHDLARASDLDPLDAAPTGEQLALAADRLRQHLVRLGQPFPDPKPEPNAAAERASRLVPPLGGFDGWEPAAANHRLRWRDLLAALARRAAEDHWYDEATPPGQYFRGIADRYIEDARKVTKDLPATVTPYRPDPTLAALLTAPPLGNGDPLTVAWTSEKERVFSFELAAPDKYPVTGQAAVFTTVDGKSALRSADRAAAADRPLRPVGPGAKFQPEAKVEVANESVEKLDEAGCKATGLAYFRGQRPTQVATINVYRKPELILADPLPTEEEKGVRVAVVADKKLKPGAVTVLVDYSGSMKWNLAGDDVFKGESWRTKESRFRMAMDALREVLLELPLGTPLRVRVFSGTVPEGEANDPRYFPPAGRGEAKVTWTKTDTAPLDELMRRLERREPYGFTPLVDSILEAAGTLRDLADESGSKTLVVLTDGVDEQQGVPNNAGRMAQLSARLTRAFKQDYPDVALHVVQFALGPTELQLSQILFGGVASHPEPGRVWPAANKGEMLEHLKDALRPKLKLLRGGQAVVGIEQSGWPSRPADDRKALHWSPFFPAGDPAREYTAKPYPAGTAVDLIARDGDRMILRFAPDERTGRVVTQRALYADFFDSAPSSSKVQRRKDDKWVLTLPGNWVRTEEYPRRYFALVHVEEVPPHRMPKAAGDAAEDRLQLARPPLIWWEVNPDLPGKPEKGTVRVTRRYAYPAPAWLVDVENWPDNAAGTRGFTPAKFKVWVMERFIPAPDAAAEVRPDGRPQVVSIDGDKVEVRFTVERFPVGPGPPRDCLVVRALHAKGKPVYARLAGDARDAAHWYFEKANGYTAAFALANPDPAAVRDLRIEFMAVAPAKTDDRGLTISPPAPETSSTEVDNRSLRKKDGS